MYRSFFSTTTIFVVCGLLIFVAGATDVAFGANLHVSTTGNDSNDCLSPATACLTIQAAVDKAADGDNINIAAGVYPGFIQINNRGQLTLQGTTTTQLIRPSGTITNRHIIGFSSSQNITLYNLKITGDIPTGIGGVAINNSVVTLLNCTVEDASGGVGAGTTSSVTIRDSIIQRNQFHGVRVDAGSIATLTGAPFSAGTTFVQDNLFTGVLLNEGDLRLHGSVTIQGNQIGIGASGGSVWSCCDDGEGSKFLNNLVGISMKGGHLNLRGPSLIAGNTQNGIALIGTSAVFNRFSTKRVVVRDNADGILAIGSHVDLVRVDVMSNTGNGVIFRDTSSARVYGSNISNNGDVGMLVERLSVVEILGDNVMENNRRFDLRCTLKSLGHGDPSGVRRMSCPEFGQNDDGQ